MAATIHNPIVLSSSSPIQALDYDRSASPGFTPSVPSLSRHSSSLGNLPELIRGHAATVPTSHEEASRLDRAVQHALKSPRMEDKAQQGVDEPARLSPHFDDTRPQHATIAPADTKGTGKRKRATKCATTSDNPPKPRKRVAAAKKTKKALSVDVTTVADIADLAEASAKPIKPAPKKPSRKRATKTAHPAETLTEDQIPQHLDANQAKSDDKEAPTDGTVSNHFADGLGLDKAPLRRRSWTPVPGDELPPSNQHVGEDPLAQQADDNAFRNIVTSFEFQDQPVEKQKTTAKPPRTATRKKKVEIVDGAAPKRKTAADRKAAAAKKQKEPKPPKPPKVVRAKTITDFAISAYRKAVDQTEAQGDVPVTAFFQPAGTQLVPLRNELELVLEPENATVSKRKNPVLQFQFPQPEKAQSKMLDQEFLFGTSSQLAKDESPRTHRMIQQAIEESEDMAFASQAKSDEHKHSPTTSRIRVVNAPHGTSLSVGPGEANLWAVAARDADLKMFISSQRAQGEGRRIRRSTSPSTNGLKPKLGQDEVDYPFRSDGPQSISSSPGLPEFDTALGSGDDGNMHDSGFVDISEVEEAHKQEDTVPAKDDITDEEIQVIQAPLPIHRPVLQALDINAPNSKSDSASLKPNFTPTTSIASPTKRLPPEPVQPAPPAAEPLKRPRGRPRKDTTTPTPAKPTATRKPKPPAKRAPPSPKAPSTPKRSPRPSASRSSWADIDEISDSEPAASPPSPPRTSTRPKPLRLGVSSPSHAAAAAVATPPPTAAVEGSQQRLFAAITAALRAQPRAADPARPSWREKMLLYDPIVLEDFTAWLVGRGVRGGGGGEGMGEEQDEEGEQLDDQEGKTKKKGKKGKGKAKKPDGGGAVLQPAAVQRWCEANSVCCLWKAGLRGGVRARY